MSEPDLGLRIRDSPRHTEVDRLGSEAGYGKDTCTNKQKKEDEKLADRLFVSIEEVKTYGVPLTKMIRNVSSRYCFARQELTSFYLFHSTFHSSRFGVAQRWTARNEEDRDEAEFVKQVNSPPERPRRS